MVTNPWLPPTTRLPSGLKTASWTSVEHEGNINGEPVQHIQDCDGIVPPRIERDHRPGSTLRWTTQAVLPDHSRVDCLLPQSTRPISSLSFSCISHNPQAVGTKGNRSSSHPIDCFGTLIDRSQFLSGIGIPKFNRVIHAGRGKHSTVRTNGNTDEGCAIALYSKHWFRTVDVVNTNSPFVVRDRKLSDRPDRKRCRSQHHREYSSRPFLCQMQHPKS